MKTILTLFVLFFSFALSAEVYFCVEDDRVGFNKDNNNQVTEFKLQKFKIIIDVKNKTVVTEEDSENIYFGSFANTECVTYLQSEIYCINDLGDAFTFNKNTNNFKVAQMINTDKDRDDPSISQGSCSEF
tara:strand:+ start:72 stop:461 length:390 start_codon:yes stop_codon:yes gene_type:complete